MGMINYFLKHSQKNLKLLNFSILILVKNQNLKKQEFFSYNMLNIFNYLKKITNFFNIFKIRKKKFKIEYQLHVSMYRNISIWNLICASCMANINLHYILKISKIISLLEFIPLIISFKFLNFKILAINFLKITENFLVRNLINYNINLFKSKIKFFEICSITLENNKDINYLTEFKAGYFILICPSLFILMHLDDECNKNHRLLVVNDIKGYLIFNINSKINYKNFILCQIPNYMSKVILKYTVKFTFCNILIFRCKISNILNVLGQTYITKLYLKIPCSGSGFFINFDFINNKHFIENLRKLQKSHLVSCIDYFSINNIKNWNIIYFSNCIFIEENEDVIRYALEKRRVQLLKLFMNIGKPGIIKNNNLIYNKNILNCKRFYPHLHYSKGFFICKMTKL